MNSPKKSLIQRMYDKALHHSDSTHARRLLYGIAFAESSFFPLPPDLLMIPMMLQNKKAIWRLAFFCTLWSVIGGLLGYYIGYGLIHFGKKIIDFYNMGAQLIQFKQQFAQYGFWLIALKGLTPIPFKLVTIASGMAHYSLPLFITASIIARSFRFYLLAALFWKFGPWAKEWIEKYLTLALFASLGVIIIGFVIVKWLFV
jgi:membrane protein YqaA with SNARE-associated domain